MRTRVFSLLIITLLSLIWFNASVAQNSASEELIVQLDWNELNAAFDAAPDEFDQNAARPQLMLPTPNGGTIRLDVERSQIMEAGIAAMYPEIESYRCIGRNGNTTIFGKVITNKYGLDGLITTLQGDIKITPVGDSLRQMHRVYWYRPDEHLTGIKCGMVQIPEPLPDNGGGNRSSYANGDELRIYRFAFTNRAQPDDFTNIATWHAPYNWSDANEFNTSVAAELNSFNTIYERDFNIRYLLSNNNHLLYSPDTIGDYPFRYPTNNALNGWGPILDSAHNYITRILGSANFDIGSAIFSYSSVGLGGGQVCNDNNKGRQLNIYGSFTTWLHEIGHMNTCPHTFNSVNPTTCQDNIHPWGAYEPGSGTTIMSYTGACGADNITPVGDRNRFHSASFRSIINHNNSVSCATTSSSGNQPPVVTVPAGGNYIPRSTPFALTGSATDPNGNPMLYSWEQMDIGPNGAPNNPSGNAPLFRVFNPVTTPTRIFPQLSDILNGTQTQGEILPSYERDMKFVLLVTDNVGGSDMEEVELHVAGNAGPFEVVSQSSYQQYASGATIDVAWTVAGTNSLPVNCTNVNILLSTDGGFTWPHTLASNTPNDGSQSVTLPNVNGGNCRIKVEAVGNVFFNINQSSFTISSNTAVSNLALDLDGTNDEVQIPGTWGNFGNGAFTIEFMIRTTASAGTVISKRDVCNYASFWHVRLVSGRVVLELCQDGSGTNYTNHFSSSTINDGNWHHVAVTRSGSTSTIYIDGILDNTSANSGANVSNTSMIRIGNQVCNNSYFDGQLDEIRVWNTARTLAQISSNLSCGFGIGTSGQLGYYDFNNPAATAGGNNAGVTLLADVTGNGADGILYNFSLSGSSSNWVNGDASVGTLWYQDNDGDDHGNPNVSTCAVAQPSGYVSSYDDCNDNDAFVFAPNTFFLDADNDTYGSNTTAEFCQSTPPAGYATNSLDCNDACNTCHPNGTEACNGLDDDCSGIVDDLDADGDGYSACDYDCDDNDANIHPYAPEVCGNSADDDCDGNTDTEVNKALHFDGVDDRVEMAAPVFVHQQTFTIEAWVKTSSQNKVIVSMDQPNTAQVFVSGAGRFGYGESDGTWSGWHAGPVVNDNTWHHVAIVRTPTTITFYTDGSQTTSVNHTATLSTSAFTIGSIANGVNPLEGAIDEVRVWSIALTEQEIADRMNIRLDGNETGLERYYHFDHAVPGQPNPIMTTLKDITSNGSDGELTNFALTGSTSNWVTSWSYPTLYEDTDMDGYGGSTAWTCGSMTSLVANNLDCDDTDANINPYSDEVCANSIDDDCDTNTDLLVNKALYFDGVNDRVTATNPFLHQQTFTLEAWVKVDPSTLNKQIMNWQGTHTGQMFVSNAGLLGYGESNGSWSGWHGGPTINDNAWHHVAVVRTPTNVTTYIDGAVGFSNNISMTLTTDRFTIGAFNNGSSGMTGAIDEVRIWSTALTPADIQERMNIRLDGNEAGLVRYFHFDHGKPAQNNVGLDLLKDHTANNGDGNLKGFALSGGTSNWVTSWTYPTLYTDNDADGYAGNTTWTCGSMYGLSTVNSDCDDNDANINPDSDELCGNSTDDNCNTVTDENAFYMDFDGVDDFVEVGSTIGNFGTGDFTMEFRVKTLQTNVSILTKRAVCDCVNFFNLRIVGGVPSYEFSEVGCGNYRTGAGSTAINDGQWHHVAYVRQSNTVRIYVDGALDATVSNVITNLNNTDPLWMGKHICPGGNPTYFQGQLDEVRLWNVARTADQIEAYQKTVAPSSTGLQSYYAFNNASASNGGNNTGLSVLDGAGSNNGTPQNMALTGTSSNWLGDADPEADMLGQSISITDGDNTPDVSDDTDFGSTNIGTAVVHTFTIENTGAGMLTVISSQIIGTNASEFTLGAVAASVNAGGSTTFTVTYDPSAVGTHNATVEIVTNDCDEGTYDFAIQGAATTTLTAYTWTGNVDTDWDDTGNWYGGSLPTASDDAIIPTTPLGGNFPTVNLNTAVCNDLTVETGATLTVSGGNAITVNGVLTNDGTMYVNNSGSLVQTTGSTIAGAGTYQVQRQGSTGQAFNFWGSPITAQNGVPGTSYSYNSHAGTQADSDDNPSDPGWNSYNGTMTPGVGYAGMGGGLVTFSGTVNNGNINRPLVHYAFDNTYSDLNPGTPFNLVGNPYPSAISAAQLVLDNPDIDGTLYFWDDDQSSGSDYHRTDFAYWNGTGGLGTGSGSVGAPNGFLSTGQGFYVRAINAGSPSIQFNNAQRVTGPNNQFFKVSGEDGRLWLSLENDSLFNEILIGLLEDATVGEDRLYDAVKMSSQNKVSLAAMANGFEHAIMAFPPPAVSSTVPLLVEVAVDGAFRFVPNTMESLEGFSVYLDDVETGSSVQLHEGIAVPVTLSAGTYENRFYLNFMPNSLVGMEDAEQATLSAFAVNDQLFVNLMGSDTENATIEVFDMQGKLVVQPRWATTGQTIIPLAGLSKGIYIVRAYNENLNLTERIFR